MKSSTTSVPQFIIRSTAIKTQCKFYNRGEGCRFGDKCRYRHEEESKETTDDASVKTQVHETLDTYSENSEMKIVKTVRDGVSETPENIVVVPYEQEVQEMSIKKREIRRPICRYFTRSGYCRDGKKCRFLHQTFKRIPRKVDDAVPEQLSSVQAKTNFTNPLKIPENMSNKLSDLTQESIKYLQAVEIEQLKKRFEELNITSDNDETVCTFNIKPSDPDWPYDVNEVELIVTFPQDYPKQIFKAEVNNHNGEFPEHFTKYVNRDIEEHLKEHEEAQKLRDSPDLLFRPFLRWLDRNLEKLFTKALKQIKFDLEAESAGLEFISFDNETKVDKRKEKEDTQFHDISNLKSKKEIEFLEENVAIDNIDKQISEKDEEGSEMFEMIEARKSQSLKKGTEVRFRGMELDENTATVQATSLTFTVQCGRCKNRDEMINVKENTQVVLTCSKCSNAQSIVFTRSAIVHQHSAILAFITPQGCSPIDLILSKCQLLVGCLNCGKETTIKGINYGSTKNVWCNHCYNKLDMKVESVRFHQLQDATVSDEKIKRVEIKKTARNKDPVIKSGQALPENGTCKHYKKSYRWMRFPCCGKCYPCDKCHEENEDGHEMEQATRMICGFCAKEQTFTHKDCVSCKSFVTAVHTSHWEGGKGCRNKMKMSRGDDKKYSDRSKTTSRHAVKVDGQKKK